MIFSSRRFAHHYSPQNRRRRTQAQTNGKTSSTQGWLDMASAANVVRGTTSPASPPCPVEEV
ncbi:hypothetical protein CH063_13965 [Colletotrichum higginsianum]|uniref:Uncharacterized protein n=1 Tax=Colletotrichum higginsianum (strain IMI 349063) TaxID=759273 RepID=H1VWL5_COLHI|nr:hypothetical protein CH63R_02389 [Colletotrichum higginsianum IMI 349063]OBR13663.1 hypothetical protein CH63R_02389 [Colletotrichum higginsianum IMI 349063]CCF44627.1 hypothetical protein CH063_13965 [Colletotrichum higginsianum]